MWGLEPAAASPRSSELREGPRRRPPAPLPAQGEIGLPAQSSAPQHPPPLPGPMTPPRRGKTWGGESTAPDRAQEWQEEQPMMVEAEHYIITVDSHWLGTQPPGPCIPAAPLGLCAPGSRILGAPLAEKARDGAERWADGGPGSATEQGRDIMSAGVTLLACRRRGFLF